MPTVLDLVDPEWGPGMCVSHKFWEPHFENHCFWGYLAIPWLPGNVAVHLDQLQFLFSLWQIRILQKLWAVFPKLRLPKMTLLGLPSYPWQSPSIQHAFPTHHLSHYFLMLGWDVLTLFSIWLSLTSLTEADEKDDSGATMMSTGSEKCILLCVHPHVFLHRIFLWVSFYFTILAGGSIYLQWHRSGQHCEPQS